MPGTRVVGLDGLIDSVVVVCWKGHSCPSSHLPSAHTTLVLDGERLAGAAPAWPVGHIRDMQGALQELQLEQHFLCSTWCK